MKRFKPLIASLLCFTLMSFILSAQINDLFIDPKRLKYGNDVIIKKEGSLQIEKDQTKRYYLHLIPGTLGADLGAGLFINN